MSDAMDLRGRVAALPPDKRRLLRARLAARRAPGPLFSLFFFGDAGVGGIKLYDLLLRTARLADARGLHAVWTPERHFQEFGGAYPDPAVLAAAIAVSTRRLRIRAGSVVLPINDTARVAERWSVVDVLSNGRVGISLAAGWHPDDFVLARRGYAVRHEVLEDQIDVLERFWRGEHIEMSDPEGSRVSVRIYPKPIQPRLPIWMTCSKSPDAWQRAARIGAHVLTGLLEQSPERLAESIAVYRDGLARHGWNPDERQVTVMLHAYVGRTDETVADLVREPLTRYLRNHMRFYETMIGRRDLGIDTGSLTEHDREALVRRGVDRYLETSALVGDMEGCRQRAAQLSSIGVDEIACLVNFGLPDDVVLGGVERLAELAHSAPAIEKTDGIGAYATT